MTRHDCRHRAQCLGEVLHRLPPDERGHLRELDCSGCRRYEHEPLDRELKLMMLELLKAAVHEGRYSREAVRRTRARVQHDVCQGCGGPLVSKGQSIRLTYCSSSCYERARGRKRRRLSLSSVGARR